MPGPWEKYQSRTPSAGPWEKYGAPPPSPAAAPGFLDSMLDTIKNAPAGIWHALTSTEFGDFKDSLNKITPEEWAQAKKNSAARADAHAKGDAVLPGQLAHDRTDAEMQSQGWGPEPTPASAAGRIAGQAVVGAGTMAATAGLAKGYGAIAEAAPEIGVGVRAATPDVAMGLAKIGGGTVAAETLPPVVREVVGIPSVYSGGRQVFQGLKKGVAAYSDARKPLIPAEPEFAPQYTPQNPQVPQRPVYAAGQNYDPRAGQFPEPIVRATTTPAAPTEFMGVPMAALDAKAVEGGFKDFASVPKDYQPIVANLTKVELAKQAAPIPPATQIPPVSVAPEVPPAPVIAQPPTAMSIRPDPKAIITKSDLAKRALADEMLKSGSATPEMMGDPAAEGPLVPDAKVLKTLMRDLPPGGPKAIANANYAGNQEPAQAAAVYEAAGRATKSQALSQMLHDEGLTSRQVARWSPKSWERAVGDRGMPTAFSKNSQGEVIQMLRNLEKTVPK